MAKTVKDVAEPDTAPVKGGKKKPIVLALVAVVAAAAAAWFLLLGPTGEAEAEVAPHAGSVLTLDSVAVNLAGGSYLKVGVALQFTVDSDAEAEASGEEHEGSKAQDLIVAHYSQAQMADVMGNREAMKEALKAKIIDAYEGAVMDIYLTEYVTQ